MNYFVATETYWSNRTLLFYMFVIIFPFLLMSLPIRNTKMTLRRNHRMPMQLLIVLILLLLVKGVGSTGADLRGGYYDNFLSATSINGMLDTSLEIGYRVLNVLCYNLTGRYSFFIFCVGLLTVLPVIWIINSNRNQVDLNVAIIMYISIYFFPGLSGLRLYIAASISLFVYDALMKKDNKRAILFLFIALAFHRTAFFLLLPIMITMFRKYIKEKMVPIIFVGSMLVLYLARFVLESFTVSSGRYYKYFAEDRVHIGLEQFVYYVPLFAIYYLGKKHEKNQYINYLNMTFLWSFFAFGIYGYIFTALGRLMAYSIWLIIIIPYYSKMIKKGHNLAWRILFDGVVLFYCLSRFIIYIVQYYEIERIMPYTNFLGMIV